MSITVNITNVTDEDYDGISTTVRVATVELSGGNHEGAVSGYTKVCPDTASDQDVIDAVTAELTADGYTWAP